MKLNKEEIRQIALTRFFDTHHESVYDCWTDALAVWLDINGCEIVKKQQDGEVEEASTDPAEPQD